MLIYISLANNMWLSMSLIVRLARRYQRAERDVARSNIGEILHFVTGYYFVP